MYNLVTAFPEVRNGKVVGGFKPGMLKKWKSNQKGFVCDAVPFVQVYVCPMCIMADGGRMTVI